MAWTYTTLKASLQTYLESDETTFVAEIPNIVLLAEDRILKSVQLKNFRKNQTGTMTDGDQYLGVPSDFLAPYSLSIDNTGHEFLLFKTVNYIREAYPISTVKGTPKHYSLFEDDWFLVGPTPNANFATELHYFYRPTGIESGSTSWLGTNAPALLFSACLLESYIFLKGDADLMKIYQKRFDTDLQAEKVLAEGRNVTDSYRYG